MTSDIKNYKLPSGLETFIADTFDVVPEFDPALTIIDTAPRLSRGTRYIRAYRWCYLDRVSLDTTISSHNMRIKVNPLSLCPQRAQVVRKLISHVMIGSISLGVFSYIERAFDWIDQLNRGMELFTLESAKQLYQDYTREIRYRMQLSNVGVGSKKVGALGYAAANLLQLGMASICAAATDFEISTVQSWTYRIPQRAKGPSRSAPAPKTTETEHAVAHSLHTRLFTAFSDAILNNTPPPVVVELSDLGFEDVIFYTRESNSIDGWTRGAKGRRVDWKPFFYGLKGVFQGELKEFNELLGAHGIESLENVPLETYRVRQRSARSFTEGTLKYMANIATRHFGYLLLAEAGSNASTLATVDCSQTQLNKILGAARLLVVKGRAGYEQQDQIVARHFAQTAWKRYLELREWMMKSLGKKALEALPSGLFLLGGLQGEAHPYPLNAASMKTCSLWPKNAPPLATRDARKHKTVNILEHLDGNVALASAVQSASRQTIERHYAHKNVIEASKQMSEYFELQAKSAALRHEGIEPVRIIEHGEDTSTGHCDAPEIEGPQIIEGLESGGIEPHCGAPLTCLFCIHFGLHAIEKDLVRLLTIKSWIEVQTRLYSSNIDEAFTKYSPYIERIEQVLEELPKRSEKFAELMNLAKTRFDEGKRDPYWVAKTNALLDLESL